jgi:Xaa-Pro dipeptidase
MSSEPNENQLIARQNQLYKFMQSSGLDALVINPSPTMIYLTGLHFLLSERPAVVLFVPGTTPTVIFPELEMVKIKTLPYPVRAFPYGEDPHTWGSVFRQAAQVTEIGRSRIGVDPRALRVLELRLLEASAPDADFVSAEETLAFLRMRKDAGEVAAMQEAVKIAQRALQASFKFIRPGKSEREIANELTLQLLKAGSDASIPFSPIVASGPNSANPHAMPTDRVLTSGDLLVIDWGASQAGYISDLTRSFAIGQVETEFVRIAKIVGEANAAGRAAVRPGITAGEVDVITRSVIVQSGYGEFFTHRTGHGIGMEGHEAPYIYRENAIRLAPGMTFTIEPGVYLPGRGGVRIEDNIVVTENGAQSLSDLPRDLITIN